MLFLISFILSTYKFCAVRTGVKLAFHFLKQSHLTVCLAFCRYKVPY
nr:MAG TPA: hypothetical protein [Caudoviricetes sp.]